MKRLIKGITLSMIHLLPNLSIIKTVIIEPRALTVARGIAAII
jgi:hypothetical protein